MQRQHGERAVKVKTSGGTSRRRGWSAATAGAAPCARLMGIEFEGFTWPERFVVISTPHDFAAHGFTSNAYVADPKEWAAVFHMPRPVAARLPGASG